MNDIQQQVAKYNQLVDAYHALDQEIDDLLMQFGGHTENMTEEGMQRYRDLARERDDVFNQMRALEQQLFTDNSE